MGNPVFVDGIAGMALSFDGVNNYVDFGNNAAFDITEQISLSAWVNTNDTGGSELKTYVDGSLGATIAHEGFIETQTHNLTIGNNSEESGRFYNGAIDEV